ncbi:hypothetical protein L2E82_47294 [Cichorium intybus]|uniref:Uncharacterized protein n=1 Tax=Cichorium intybus TaxID=13427 RepID=A0ACB8YWB4_CICIN|nr:hypothetical protein L2E82_47294 [Cichorium intybus]
MYSLGHIGQSLSGRSSEKPLHTPKKFGSNLSNTLRSRERERERERKRFLVRETKNRRWKASKKRHVKIVLKKGKFRNLRGVLSSFYLL